MEEIGQYSNLKEVGQGLFGTVFKATNDENNQSVALKLFSPRENTIEAFLPEPYDRAVKRLDDGFTKAAHLLRGLGRRRYILECLDFGRSEFGPYIVTPFLGSSLEQDIGPDRRVPKALKRFGKAREPQALSIERTLYLMGQLLDGMTAAHEVDLVHRNLRPSNIRLTSDDEVAISDFGMARPPSGAAPASQTPEAQSRDGQSAVLFGTGYSAYMAPEQREGAKGAGPRSDVFALGVLFFRMLVGQLPANAYQSPVKLVPKLGEDLSAIIETAVDADPSKRFADAGEMYVAFESALVAWEREHKVSVQTARKPARGMEDEKAAAAALPAEPIPDAPTTSGLSEFDASLSTKPSSLILYLIGGIAALMIGATIVFYASGNDEEVTEDEIAWTEARDIDSEQAYLEYLSSNPDGAFRERADNAIARIRAEADREAEAERTLQLRQQELDAWANAVIGDSNESYKQYLENWPDGANAGQARQRLDDIAFEAATDKESIGALIEYQNSYPEGLHVSRLDDQAWELVLRNGTEQGLDNYRAAFPDGRHRDKIEGLRAAFRERDIRLAIERDDAGWAVALRNDSEEAYAKYLADFPSGAYRSAASESYEELRADRLTREAREALVSSVQTELLRLGYAGITVNGRDGEATIEAIRSYERWTDRTVTGAVTEEIRVALVGQQSKPLPVIGRRYRDCEACPELIVLAPGSFQMGSPNGEANRLTNEGPQHNVQVPVPTAIGVYEVTIGEWRACVAGGGCNGYFPASLQYAEDNAPMVLVSWQDAQAYVRWLSETTGDRYRLLTEAEWEYSARAGTSSAIQGVAPGVSACQRGNAADAASGEASFGGVVIPCNDGYIREAPVGSFPANAFGLYDMPGNVLEWTEDCMHSSYQGAPSDATIVWNYGATTDCGRRIARGGSWGMPTSAMRSAARYPFDQNLRTITIGFRVAVTLTR